MTVLTPKVPAGMVDLMKSLSKSVLKEKPENIYEYAAAYFESMLKKRDGSLDKGYGKFRSYQKYCAFVEKMQVRQQNMDKQNDETDSGVGSSNTDDETTKTACDEAVASSSSALKMAVNGVAIQASKRNPKPPVQQKKTKNYSVNPKLKAQGSIERDRKGRAEAKDANAALTKKSKAKPRKLSSKKPSENLIVIKEETSADVAEVDDVVKMSSAAAMIQRVFRKYQRDKEMERMNVIPAIKNAGMNENMAAAIIQRLFKSVLSKKQNLSEKLEKENIAILNDGDNNALKEGDTIIDPSAVMETASKDPQIELFIDAENDKKRSINVVDSTKNGETLDQAKDFDDEKGNSDAILAPTLDSAVNNTAAQNEDIATDFFEPTLPHNVNIMTNAKDSDVVLVVVDQTNLDNIEAAKRISEISSPEQQLLQLQELKDNNFQSNVKTDHNNQQLHVDELKDEFADEENALHAYNIENIGNMDQISQPHGDQLKDDIADEENVLHEDNIKNIENMDHVNQSHADELKDNIADEVNALHADNIQNIENMDQISQPHGDQLKDDIADEENVLHEDNIQNIENMDHVNQPHGDELNDNISDDVNALHAVNIQNMENMDQISQPLGDQLKDDIADEENVLHEDNIQNMENMDHVNQPHGDELKDNITDEENALHANHIEQTDPLSLLHANKSAENESIETAQTSLESTEMKAIGKEQHIQQLNKVVGISGKNLDKELLDLTAASPTDQQTEYELAETVILGHIDDVQANVEEMTDLTRDAKVASFEEVGLKLIPSDIIENPRNTNYMESAKIDNGDVESEKISKLTKITEQNILEIQDEVGMEDLKKSSNVNDEPTIADIGEEVIHVNPVETFEMESDKVKITTDIIDSNEKLYTPIEPLIEVKASEQKKSEQLSETIDGNNKLVAFEELKSIDKGETFDSVTTQSVVDHITPNDDSETVEPLENLENKKPNDNEVAEQKFENNIEPTVKPDTHDDHDINIRSKREFKVEDNEVNTDNLVGNSEDKAAGESIKKSDNFLMLATAVESNIKTDNLNVDDIIEPITHAENIKDAITTSSAEKFVASAPAESPDLLREGTINDHSKTEQNFEINSEKILETNLIETFKLDESADDLITETDQIADLKNEVDIKIPETTTKSNCEAMEETEKLNTNVNEISEVSPISPDQSLHLQNEENNVYSSEGLDKTYIIETSQNISDEISANIQDPENNLEENSSSVVITLDNQLANEDIFSKPKENGTEISNSFKDTNNEENETIAIHNITEGIETVGEILKKVSENQMISTGESFSETYTGNEIIEGDGVVGGPTDQLSFERNAKEATVEIEQVTGEINEKNPKSQIIETEGVSSESAGKLLLEKVSEKPVDTESKSHFGGILPKASIEIDAFTKEVDMTDNIASSGESLTNSRTRKTDESVNEISIQSKTAFGHNSDLLVIDNEIMNSSLYAKLEALEVCNEPLTNPEDTKETETSKTADFGEYVNQIDNKSLINTNQIHLSNNNASVDIIKEEEDSDDWTDTENPDESGNTTVRDWFNDKDKNTAATEVQYELLSSDLSGTEEKNPEQFKESGIDETSRDELDDLSEVENFDLSSCGEDSLEAMYYSLRKNEIMVDKMHRRASEQRGVAESEPDVDENIEPIEPKVPFPTKITEHLDSAMNEVLGSEKSDRINTSVGSDSDDVVVGSMQDGYPEGSTNLSSTESEVEPIQLKIESPIKTKANLNDDDEFMDPMNYAMQQKDELLQRMHGTWFQETINQSNESDQYNEDLDEFPDNPNYARSASNQRKMWTTSVSEADSDYMESAANRRLTKDDFNISTAFDHLTSTDSDSTIVSAATKIQAGARGFLTRRRLRRSSMGTTLSADNTQCSFGNAAIDKSLEDLIEQQEIISQDDAAIKIQHSYRRYRNKKKLNDQKDSQYDIEQYSIDDGGEDDAQHGIIEIKCEKRAEQLKHGDTRDVQSTSQSPHRLPREEEERYENIIISNEYLEQQQQHDADSPKIDANDARQYHQLSTATGNTDVLDTAQRRQTLQRGDAVQRHSTPEEIETLLLQQNQPKAPVANATAEQETLEINLETGERAAAVRSSSLNTTKRAVSIRSIGQRQKSMPVQIDTEIMRVIPKHLRKRIKSADSMKRRSN